MPRTLIVIGLAIVALVLSAGHEEPWRERGDFAGLLTYQPLNYMIMGMVFRRKR
jgi:hypothetical protein